MANTEVFYRDEGVGYGRCGPVWVMLLRATPTAERMFRAEPTLVKMKAACPQGFATLTWVLPSAGVLMDAPARNAAAEITRAYADDIKAIANVVEGTGFAAATARAVLSGLHLLSRISKPERTFAHGDEAFDWLLRMAELEVGDHEALRAALAGLRTELGG